MSAQRCAQNEEAKSQSISEKADARNTDLICALSV